MRHFGTHTARLKTQFFFSFAIAIAGYEVLGSGIVIGRRGLVTEEAGEVDDVAAGEADEGVGFCGGRGDG